MELMLVMKYVLRLYVLCSVVPSGVRNIGRGNYFCDKRVYMLDVEWPGSYNLGGMWYHGFGQWLELWESIAINCLGICKTLSGIQSLTETNFPFVPILFKFDVKTLVKLAEFRGSILLFGHCKVLFALSVSHPLASCKRYSLNLFECVYRFI